MLTGLVPQGKVHFHSDLEVLADEVAKKLFAEIGMEAIAGLSGGRTAKADDPARR